MVGINTVPVVDSQGGKMRAACCPNFRVGRRQRRLCCNQFGIALCCQRLCFLKRWQRNRQLQIICHRKVLFKAGEQEYRQCQARIFHRQACLLQPPLAIVELYLGLDCIGVRDLPAALQVLTDLKEPLCLGECGLGSSVFSLCHCEAKEVLCDSDDQATRCHFHPGACSRLGGLIAPQIVDLSARQIDHFMSV